MKFFAIVSAVTALWLSEGSKKIGTECKDLNDLPEKFPIDQPSLFDTPSVSHLAGGDYKKLREMPTIAYVYHPNCPWSQASIPEFSKFAENAKQKFSDLRIIEINASSNECR